MNKLSFEKVWNDLLIVLERDRDVYTLSQKKLNRVEHITDKGISVVMERSSPTSKLVHKWMFEKAANHLISHGSLSNLTLLNELNVNRSSFVMAALSKLDYIEYENRPVRIFLMNQWKRGRGKGDVGSKTTYDFRNRFNMV